MTCELSKAMSRLSILPGQVWMITQQKSKMDKF